MKKIMQIIKFKKKGKKVNLHLVLAVVVLIGGFLIYRKYWNVAVVNGRPVSRIDYFKKMEKQVGQQVLDQMIIEAMVLKEASKNGFKVDNDVINSEITKIEEQIKAQGQTLEAALEVEGMTRADLEKQILLQKIAENLSKPNKEVSEKEIADFLTENKEQLSKTATKQELNDLAKTQLENQKINEAVSTWLTNLKENAKIIYR